MTSHRRGESLLRSLSRAERTSDSGFIARWLRRGERWRGDLSVELATTLGQLRSALTIRSFSDPSRLVLDIAFDHFAASAFAILARRLPKRRTVRREAA